MQKLTAMFLVLVILAGTSGAQVNSEKLKRPKLVVGIIVDQMRWDYLYRYYDRYVSNGGFKRILNYGYSCENTLIPYIPTYTACGHAGIYTGSVPAVNGITGNSWWDNLLDKTIYCVQDDSAKTVGSNTELGQMSPKNMLVTSVCDELKLATNFRSKVMGFAIKDRGAILPAGHSADAAYWYDNKTGDWITSTYYMNSLPQWMKDFNAKKIPDKLYEQGWSTLYPVNSYQQSIDETKSYLAKPFGPRFPYDLKKFEGSNYGVIDATPLGNSLTFEVVKAGVNAEELGKDSIPDFLAISLSSPDYIGHTFGPNSIETEDCYLRLDKELGELMDFLDEKTGKGQYILFLSADHGAANAPSFLKENKIPAGQEDDESLFSELNRFLKEKTGADNLVKEATNFQVFLNHTAINNLKKGPDEKTIIKWIIDYLTKLPGIARAFDLAELSQTTLTASLKEKVVNGYYPQRSGDVQFILQPQWLENLPGKGTTHGSWYAYDSHIPLLWYGWGVKQGKTNRQTSMADIAPTLSAMLHIQMPSGSIGHVIEEVTK
ncbi:MAG: alkaline phosphatase family protein [Bacteroidetes bacterium]|nr:alkaline phosphatase family protein [Bacteroidota bacterium]